MPSANTTEAIDNLTTAVESLTTTFSPLVATLFLFALIAIAVALVAAMFLSREQLLGFPCVIFWGILSGYSYQQSTATWDIYYFLFFASAGMAIFCAIAMYGLHKSKKLERTGEEEWLDEKTGGADEPAESSVDDFPEEEPSERVKGVQDRAGKRRKALRSGEGSGRMGWGEFK